MKLRGPRNPEGGRLIGQLGEDRRSGSRLAFGQQEVRLLEAGQRRSTCGSQRATESSGTKSSAEHGSSSRGSIGWRY
jgi:hypothetical protein